MEAKEKIYEGKKAFDIEDLKIIQAEKGPMRIRGYANTKNVADRYGDIPTVFGGRSYVYELTEYKKNPVLLLDHENEISSVVGSIDHIEEDPRGLYFEATLSESSLGKIEHARTVYAEGHAKGISIAGRFHYENATAPNQLTLAEIYEISLVAIPADPNSLAQVVDNSEVEKALAEASAAVKAVTDNLEIKKVVKDVQKTKALLTGKAR